MKANISDVSKTLRVLPKILNYMGEFKPKLEITIKKNELKTLMLIDGYPNMPIKYYVDMVGLEGGSFTYVVDKLVNKNLIVRIKDENDKRVSVLNLTDEGKDITNQVGQQFSNQIEETFRNLSEESIEKIKIATELLEEVLEELTCLQE